MIYDKKPSVHYMGVKIDNVNLTRVREILDDALRKNRKGYVCVTDVGNVVGAARDPRLREAINSSLLSVADGMPLAWYGRMAGCSEIERIPGMELMAGMFAGKNGYRHFLLGDTEERINRVIEKARAIDPGIRISGHSPPFKDFDHEDNRRMLDIVNRAKPDIVWISFGGGKQEQWMHNNIGALDRGVMIGVGAAFKWFVGDLVTPPKILQNMGLQWTFRIVQHFIQNPRKNVQFIVKTVLKRKIIFVCHFPAELIRARRKLEKEGKVNAPLS